VKQETDLFVVGGGPAGLAVGIAAAQRGLSVTVADVARPPIDKACGEGIMPDGLLALRAIGVDLTGLAASPFEGIRFVDAAGETHARFPRGGGLGMRRAALHSILVAKAESAGVCLAWGTGVEAVRQGEVVADGTTIKSGWSELIFAPDSGTRHRQVVSPALRLPDALSDEAVVSVC